MRGSGWVGWLWISCFNVLASSCFSHGEKDVTTCRGVRCSCSDVGAESFSNHSAAPATTSVDGVDMPLLQDTNSPLVRHVLDKDDAVKTSNVNPSWTKVINRNKAKQLKPTPSAQHRFLGKGSASATNRPSIKAVPRKLQAFVSRLTWKPRRMILPLHLATLALQMSSAIRLTLLRDVNSQLQHLKLHAMSDMRIYSMMRLTGLRDAMLGIESCPDPRVNDMLLSS